MRPLRLAILLCLLLMPLLRPVDALAEDPEKRGMMRDFMKRQILSFAVTPKGTLLASAAGIYRSTDGGGSWTLVTPTLDLGGALHVGRDGAIYASGIDMYGGGAEMLPEDQHRSVLLRSTDDGLTWTELHAGKMSELIITAISTGPGGTVFLGSGQPFSAGRDSGLYRSTDGGKSFTLLTSKYAVFGIETSADGTLFVSTGDGLLSSTDRGGTLTASSLTAMTGAVRSRGKVMLASTMDGLYRSADGGKTWTPPDEAVKDVVPIAAWLPGKSVAVLLNHAFANGELELLISEDNGVHWKTASTKILTDTADVLAVHGKTIFIGTRRSGLHRSKDGGKTFTAVFPLAGF